MTHTIAIGLGTHHKWMVRNHFWRYYLLWIHNTEILTMKPQIDHETLLLMSSHSIRRCHPGCRKRKTSMVLPSTGPWMLQYRLVAKMTHWFISDMMIVGVSPTFWLDIRPAIQKDSMTDTVKLEKSQWLETSWEEPVCVVFCLLVTPSHCLPNIYFYTHRPVLLSTLLKEVSLCCDW